MRYIKNFEELEKIEDEKWDDVFKLDLVLIRQIYNIINGVIFLIGANCKESLELFFMHEEDYESLTNNEKKWIKHFYGVLK